MIYIQKRGWLPLEVHPFFIVYSELSFYNPLKSTPSNSNDGIRQLENRRGSFPTSARLFHNEIIFPVAFISEIGCVSLPFQ